MALDSLTFQYVRDLVYQRSGIVVDQDKEYLVESRLRPLAVEGGFGSVDALIHEARVSAPRGGLHSRVVEAMTTNETSFFRDAHPFDALRTELLGRLAARAPGRGLVIWCGACSTGQEPYSLAMLLREHFPSIAASVKILATDLSSAVLERATEGVYRQIEVNRGLPASYLVKYFDKDGPNWRLKAEIRSMVRFFPLNLLETWPPLGQVDIVFLRNVLIYFDVETKRTILGKVRRCLTPDGVLFLGAAETTLNIDDAFIRKESGRTVYYQIGPTT